MNAQTESIGKRLDLTRCKKTPVERGTSWWIFWKKNY